MGKCPPYNLTPQPCTALRMQINFNPFIRFLDFWTLSIVPMRTMWQSGISRPLWVLSITSLCCLVFNHSGKALLLWLLLTVSTKTSTFRPSVWKRLSSAQQTFVRGHPAWLESSFIAEISICLIPPVSFFTNHNVSYHDLSISPVQAQLFWHCRWNKLSTLYTFNRLLNMSASNSSSNCTKQTSCSRLIFCADAGIDKCYVSHSRMHKRC